MHVEMVILVYSQQWIHLGSVCTIVIGRRSMVIHNRQCFARESSLRDNVNSCSKMLKGLVNVVVLRWCLCSLSRGAYVGMLMWNCFVVFLVA